MAPYWSPSSRETASRLRSISAPAAAMAWSSRSSSSFDGVARDEPARDAKSLVVHHQRFADRPRRAKRQFLVVFACDALCAARTQRDATGAALRGRATIAIDHSSRAAAIGDPPAPPRRRATHPRQRPARIVRLLRVRTTAARRDCCYSTFPFSSKLRATNSASASRAAWASGPVASIRNCVPSTAASVRMARMLLPSTRSPSLITSIFDSISAGQLDEHVGRARVQPLRIGHHDGSCQWCHQPSCHASSDLIRRTRPAAAPAVQPRPSLPRSSRQPAARLTRRSRCCRLRRAIAGCRRRSWLA